MRLLIDACVLYPTVLREIIVGLAATGYFEPLWSARILEEWARAAARNADEDIARGEIAILQAQWPQSEVTVTEATLERLWLPDVDDIHVLAAAVDSKTDAILTLNIRDFPTRILSAEGILRRDPDGFLYEALGEEPQTVRQVVETVHGTACRLSGEELDLRALLKRARLPRLGKALTRSAS